MTPDKSKTMDAAEKLMLDLIEIRHNGSLRGNPRRRVRILSRKKLNSAVSTRLLSAMVTGLGLPSALSRRFRYSAGLTRSSSAPLPKQLVDQILRDQYVLCRQVGENVGTLGVGCRRPARFNDGDAGIGQGRAVGRGDAARHGAGRE